MPLQSAPDDRHIASHRSTDPGCRPTCTATTGTAGSPTWRRGPGWHKRDRVRGIRFRRNFGKAAALSAGFALVRGEMVMTMDADLQNGLAALPATATGAWSDLDAVTKSFTSHTGRSSGNSCSFVRMTK